MNMQIVAHRPRSRCLRFHVPSPSHAAEGGPRRDSAGGGGGWGARAQPLLRAPICPFRKPVRGVCVHLRSVNPRRGENAVTRRQSFSTARPPVHMSPGARGVRGEVPAAQPQGEAAPSGGLPRPPRRRRGPACRKFRPKRRDRLGRPSAPSRSTVYGGVRRRFLRDLDLFRCGRKLSKNADLEELKPEAWHCWAASLARPVPDTPWRAGGKAWAVE